MNLSVDQAAERLKISRYRVRQLAESGELTHLPLNIASKRKFYRFDERVVRGYAQTFQTKPQIQLPIKTNGQIPEGYLNSKEAAIFLGLKESTLYGRVTRGELKKIKIGGHAYFYIPAATTSIKPTIQTIAGSAVLKINSRVTLLEKQMKELIEALGGLADSE